MKITNKNKVDTIEDVCGVIRELYNSEKLSISIATITGKAIPHLHRKMEEIYYVIKGKGKITIGNETREIVPGDLIPIPKNKFHFLEAEQNSEIEVLVATNPKFDVNDVIKQVS